MAAEREDAVLAKSAPRENRGGFSVLFYVPDVNITASGSISSLRVSS